MSGQVLNGDDLIIGSDNSVVLRGLLDKFDPVDTDEVTPKYIDDATVTFTLKSVSFSGSDVATGTLTAVGEDGEYRGTIEDATSLTDGTTYYETITVDAGTDRVRLFRSKRIARY